MLTHALNRASEYCASLAPDDVDEWDIIISRMQTINVILGALAFLGLYLMYTKGMFKHTDQQKNWLLCILTMYFSGVVAWIFLKGVICFEMILYHFFGQWFKYPWTQSVCTCVNWLASA